MSTHRISPARRALAYRLADEASRLNPDGLAAIADQEVAARIEAAKSIRIRIDLTGAVQCGDRIAAFARLDFSAGVGRQPESMRVHVQGFWNGPGDEAAVRLERVAGTER